METDFKQLFSSLKMQQKYCLVSDCLLLLWLLLLFLHISTIFLKTKRDVASSEFQKYSVESFWTSIEISFGLRLFIVAVVVVIVFFFWMQTVSLKSKRDMTSSKFQFQKRQWKNIPPFLSLKLTGKKSYHRNLRFQMNAFILILCDFSFFREEL